MKNDKIIQSLQQHLEDGEEVLEMISGSYMGITLGQKVARKGSLVATNKRLLFYSTRMFKGYDLEVFPYSNISSIEMSKKLFGYSISFFAVGNKTEMTAIRDKDVDAFVKYVRDRISNTTVSNNHQSEDVMDQLKKLGELKASGVISEQEFEEKKKEMLSRI